MQPHPELRVLWALLVPFGSVGANNIVKLSWKVYWAEATDLHVFSHNVGNALKQGSNCSAIKSAIKVEHQVLDEARPASSILVWQWPVLGKREWEEPIFTGDGWIKVVKTLRYNVYRNLAECEFASNDGYFVLVWVSIIVFRLFSTSCGGNPVDHH